MVHDAGGQRAVVGHGVGLHLLEGCALDDVVHNLLRQGAPHKLQDLPDLLLGVLEQQEWGLGRGVWPVG